MPSLTACYDEALSRDRTIGGRLIVSFAVETDGRVSKTRVDWPSNVADSTLISCTRNVFARLTFPAPAKRTVPHVGLQFDAPG